MASMKSRFTFSKYIFDLHELINKMLNKKSNLTYEKVRETYEHFRARCTESKRRKTNKTKKKEMGCIKPLYGEKSKCVLRVIPQKIKVKSLIKQVIIVRSHHNHRSKINLFQFVPNVLSRQKIYFLYLD